ncbi:Serine-aspartate repeat-containing protein D precursor [Anatilimnocola aggregata]|uniref:Serine-aspartate repeat-containing protein D n=1 Tax=Anatilimnocola aggregata TaxID=2528021 RepID=A0A517Y8T4_9BACT|nr:tandem-95 repeat protein [Anatilimnocola aggregata]QDU26633.1 Serine-aspartate repeat-containing protein D precursor [Anatilimnocola aggregata]
MNAPVSLLMANSPKKNRGSKSSSTRNNKRRRFLSLENLEGRSLLAMLVADVLQGTANTAVSGTVYEDVNSNGVRDGGENGIAGWTVYLDLDNSGTLNNDAAGTQEPSAVTNVDGDYRINRLVPNTYRVGEVVQSGWTATAPVSQDVIVTQGQSTQADFFNFSGGDIVGTVWNDLDQDSIRATDPVSGAFTEPGLVGWTVFLDLDNDRALGAGEPATVTAADGSYSFVGLPPDDYEVTEVLPAGWDVPSRFDIRQTASVVAREQVVQDFANFSMTNGSIQGVIWNDTNANGVRETNPTTGEFTEPGLADWTVFLDANNNRALDVGELSTVTDTDGNYAFISLDAGDYEVTEVLPSGWSVSPTFDSRQTVAVNGGEVSTADDFANFTSLNGSISGTVWNDLNRNSLRDVSTITGAYLDPGLANWTIYLDLNRNRVADATEPTTLTDAAGNYLFADLQVGEYQVIEVLPTGWEAASTFSDSESVVVYSGAESVAPDFANYNIAVATPGSLRGTVWNDINSNGIRNVNATTGEFTDPGLAGWTVYADLNSDRLLSVGEPQATSAADGSYTLPGILPGTITIYVQPTTGWRATAPLTNSRTVALRSGDTVSGLDFGEAEIRDSSIRGVVFADSDRDQVRDAGERGLGGVTVYLDLNNSATLDVGEPEVQTSVDLYYTPGVDEAGTYSFTHLASGTYSVRQVVPATLSATPAAEREHVVTITAAGQSGVDFASVYRANEIHGTRFDDANGNHVRDAGEMGVGGATIYVDLDRDDIHDADEPSTMTSADGSYTFTNLTPGAYIVREIISAGYTQTSPTTVGGILWPSGVSNPAVGNVNPPSITTSLAIGASHRQTVSLTLPDTGALTNLVDVFLLFDDTGSFVNNSPIVRSAFPSIISQLQTSLPGIDLGFGVGRLEEYANFASEYATGRPFTLNQPIVAASTTGYLTAIQAALNRTTPGYGGDGPETDIEALYQLVTGRGFDGNNNGSVLDSGRAGLAATQLNPGSSGDVPSFASFTADAANSVMPAAGSLGGAGFRAGALPIILLATDIGFAYQPQGETSVTGLGGLTLPVSAFTQTSRPTTPFNNGAGIQQTITGLNALGALVIGLGTNPQATIDPRQGLEAISKLTGATNQSTATIANGTADPIAPGDPLYFQIASGFGASVANGVTSAIQNAVTNVAVDIELQASDPRVRIVNHTGTLRGLSAGSTASFDFEFVGDGIPHRFDLQFVRAGTNVVLGSIPVVIGTPVPGDGYEFEDLEEGEIEYEDDFGAHASSIEVINVAPSFVSGGNVSVSEDSGLQSIVAWATAISAGPASELSQSVNFLVSNDSNSLFSVQPTVSADGTLNFTPAANAFGTATVIVQLHDNGGTANGGIDTSAVQTFTISLASVNDAPVATADSYATAENASLTIAVSGVLSNDTDIEGGKLTAVLATGPSHGTLTLNANGSFSYSPNANYNGTDSFTYKTNDGVADSNIVTVSLAVTPVNTAPLASVDSYTIAEDTQLSIITNGVLANDTDADSATLTAVLVAGPSHGTLTLNPDGSFAYSPTANYNGPDSFAYQANDGTLDSAITTVNLTVIAVNDAPIASGEVYSTAEDVLLAVMAGGVLSNDVDVDGNTLRAILVSGPSHGTLMLNPDGSFVYSPISNYNGADSFVYRANDGSADSNLITVSITVTPVNDPPVGVNDGYQTNQGIALPVPATTGVLANDREVDGDSLSAALSTNPANGTLVFNSNGSFTYTPRTGFSGIDSFAYLASDGLLNGNLVTVTIDVKTLPTTSDTKFIVVDATADQTFNYDAAGNLVVRHSLNKQAQESRGVAANKDGSVYWVVDKDGKVFVHDQSGRLLGQWQTKGIDKPEGIATNGTDLWIVDRETDRIFLFAGAAARRSGSVKATSNFALAVSNRDPFDVTTDGAHLWVVNNTNSVDKVFRYSLSGAWQGSWQIDATNRNPTGLTIDPNDVNHIWIVDSGTDRVYEYSSAVSRLSGQQSAALSFALNSADGNPQGIADPRQAIHLQHVDEQTLAAVATAHDVADDDVWTAALQAVMADQERNLRSAGGGIMQPAAKLQFRHRGR